MTHINECPSCGLDCRVALHTEMHAASDRIRGWLRERVQRAMPSDEELLAPKGPGPLRIPGSAPADRPLNERTREGRRIPKTCPTPAEKRNRPGGPGRGSQSRSGLTGRAILDRLGKGESMAQIAVACGVDNSAVSRMLSRACRHDEKLRLEYAAMTVCPKCGRAKPACFPDCQHCGKRGGRGRFARRAT